LAFWCEHEAKFVNVKIFRSSKGGTPKGTVRMEHEQYNNYL